MQSTGTVMDDQVARRIYVGLREHGMAFDFTCPYDELPHDYRQQLRAIADSIPFPDPYERLLEFRQRSRDVGHYMVGPLITGFLRFKGFERGG